MLGINGLNFFHKSEAKHGLAKNFLSPFFVSILILPNMCVSAFYTLIKGYLKL